MDFWYCFNSCWFLELDFFFETSFGKLRASWFPPVFFHWRNSQNSLRSADFRFLEVGSRNFGFWEEKIRFLGVKNWIWVLRRKKQISWTEWKIEIWVLKRKHQISRSEILNLGSEKKKSDFLEWKLEIWVLRRRKIRFRLDFYFKWKFGFWEEKNQMSWSEKSTFRFWEEEKSDFDLIFRFLRLKSWKADFLFFRVESDLLVLTCWFF